MQRILLASFPGWNGRGLGMRLQCLVCMPTCMCVNIQVGSELQERKQKELERLFTALENYMRY